MTRDISVSIAVQGEKEFIQALKNAQSAAKVLVSELKASEAAFDESADAQAFYANKTRNINDQIEQQRTILRSLEQAVREAGEEFGDASTKTDRYRIEINRTQASISKLEKELRQTQREAEELGRDSTRVGRQIEDGLGDSADSVSSKLDQMTQMLGKDLGEISGALKFSAVMELGEMAISALDGIASFVEGTEDYRRSMSFLEINAKNAGFEFEYIKGLLMDVSSLTGDTDGAFEGLSNLLAIGFDGKELEEAIDLIGGAVIRFPETMKFENLAESLQETIATGSATGAYGELLERLGVDIDEFNKAIEQATTAEERQQIALAYLNEHGLEETKSSYVEMNQGLVNMERAQREYEDSLAGLSSALEPAAIAWTKFKTSFVDDAVEIINVLNEFNTETAQKRAEGQSFWEILKIDELPGDIVKGFKDETGLEMAIYGALFESLGTWVKEGVNDLFDGAIEAAENKSKKRAELMKESKLGAALDWWSSLWIDDESKKASSLTTEEAQTVVDDTATKLEAAAEGKGDGFWTKLLGVGTAVAEEADNAVVDVVTEIEEAAKAEEENMKAIGGNWIAEMGNGISDRADAAIDAAISLWHAVKEILTQQITIPAPKLQKGTYDGAATLKGGGNGLGGSSHVELVAKIDKTTVARATSGEINSLLGESAERAERYG